MTRRALTASAVLAALVAAGCGSGSEPSSQDPRPQARTKPSPSPSPSPSPRPGRARSAAAEARPVIDGWAKALARSDVERASSFFALPVVVMQGASARLRDRAQVRTFNGSLPCGARLLGVRSAGRYVIGTFRLTQRPGQRCDAPGGTARVAFLLRGERFAEWRQLPEPEAAPQDPEQPEEPPAGAEPV